MTSKILALYDIAAYGTVFTTHILYRRSTRCCSNTCSPYLLLARDQAVQQCMHTRWAALCKARA